MPLLKAVTAFTVAHSITLALATLGFVHVPSKPVEAIIALSIVFLAAEIIHKRNRPNRTDGTLSLDDCLYLRSFSWPGFRRRAV